ncbi:MAG: DUF2911 domain-containing protein [Bacteroidota bacterium]
MSSSSIFTSLSAVLLFFATVAEAQIGRLPLSPIQRLEQNIGLTDIIIEYSRPSMRDRKIFGALVPFEKLWRTGANRNTTIQFSKDIIVDDQKIEAGKYAVFSTPFPKKWEVILYTDTDNWNVPEQLDTSKIAASVSVETILLEESKEVFTIMIGDFNNYQFNLDIYWENTFVSIPIQLTTKEMMDQKIKDQLEGPSHDDYYAAARYQMESGEEFAKGLDWINRAIEMAEEVTWWDLRIKAILLMELNRKDEAVMVATEGLKMAEVAKREYGINEFNKILKQLK